MAPSSSTSLSAQLTLAGPSLVPNPAFDIPAGEQERRNFHFFRERTVPQLSGFFGSEFWEGLVPRTTHHHPAIRHGVLALGSLHERFEMGDRSIFASNLDTAQGGFALQQYNRAIQSLIKTTSTEQGRSLDICLIACVLFACFETLRGHHASSMSHIMSGVKIIEGIQEPEIANVSSRKSNPDAAFHHAPREKFEVLFNRLDIQVNQLLGTRPMNLQVNPKAAIFGFGPRIPETFSSLEEARNSMDYHTNGYVGMLKRSEYGEIDSEEEAERGRKYYLVTLAAWNVAFERFLDLPDTVLDLKSQQGAIVLKIYQRIGVMHLKLPASRMLRDESIWDDFIPEGEEIVSMVESVIALNDSAASSHRPDFTFEISIVGPLYSVAHKCRDPFVRRKAISLLRSSLRQEGIWDSNMAAQVAERIITIEESGLGEVRSAKDVPDWARISDVEASFDPVETKATFSYSRQRSKLEYIRETVVETLKW